MMDDIVKRRILPQVDGLVAKLLRERRDFVIDGVRVFDQDDIFLPGKIAAIMAYRITSLDQNDPRLPGRLSEFDQLANMTLNSANESWGIYYYLSALDDLRQAGLLDRALKPETLAALRIKLDWRRFVRPDYSLINMPNNYYGVAFAVARLRYRLGWEDSTASNALLTRTLSHYRTYSGQYGFADETDGEGRFDRYSVLLIAEIAERLAETDTAVPPEVRDWLKGSARLALLRINSRGEGWEYGRSIGAYGETALLEILSVAARLKLLSPDEEKLAYAFCSRVAARYTDFWVDPQTGSVNLWDKGRRTDAYRGKYRIFGENLSLARQYLYTNQIWKSMGYGAARPDSGFWAESAHLSPSTLTWFSKGKYDRALLTIRDRGRVISLPVINGAEGWHRTNPYFPIPFSPGLLQGTAGGTYPLLIPQIRLADGTTLAPLAFFRDLRMQRKGGTTIISWSQDHWDRTDSEKPAEDARLSVHTRYIFSPGRIVREDDIRAQADLQGAKLAMEFAGFSGQPVQSANGVVRFGQGGVTGFSMAGYGNCRAGPADAGYAAPTGRMTSLVGCSRSLLGKDKRLRLRWELTYAPAPD